MKRSAFLFAILCGSVLTIGATKAFSQQQDTVSVYRWNNVGAGQYCTTTAEKYSDSFMEEKGWNDKTLLFYAYKNAGPHSVAVYGWTNKLTGTYISVAADEFTDEQMAKNGYSGKTLLFYAPTQKSANTVCVYRAPVAGKRNWITIVDDGHQSDRGASHKTFQYYGIVAR